MKAGSLISAGWPPARLQVPGASGRIFRKWVALVLLVLQAGGCYRYVPISTAQATPSTAVSVRINDQGRLGLASSIGPGVTRITGLYRANSDTTLVIDMHSVEITGLAAPVQMAGATVQVPRSYVEEFRERRLSRSRTIIAGVLIGLGLVASFFGTVHGFSGGDPTDRPGGDGGDGH